jgi:hypothetical protein
MENCLRADADGLIGSNAITAYTKPAHIAGDSALTTFGREKNTEVTSAL